MTEPTAMVESTHAPLPSEASPLKELLNNPEALKDYPVDVVERLFAIHKDEREHQKEERAYNAEMDFTHAYMAVCEEIEPVGREAYNDQTKSHYAKLEHVEAMLNPIIKKHGLKCTVTPDVSDRPVGADGLHWTRFSFVCRHRWRAL